MDIGHVLLLALAIWLLQAQWYKYLIRSAVNDSHSVVHLSKHLVVAQEIKRTFEYCFFLSTDVIQAYDDESKVLSRQKQLDLEGTRIYLLKQWDLLEDKITVRLKEDQSKLISLRGRERQMIQNDIKAWRTYVINLINIRNRLQRISLLPNSTSQQ